MGLLLPEYTWLATGSKNNFKIDLLNAIKKNEIIAFPDKSEYLDWSNKANELNKLGFKIRVSDYIEKQYCEDGTDLADLYLRLNKKEQTFDELSSDEKQIINTSKLHPNLLKLIETFELCDTFDNPFDVKKIKKFI